MDSGIFRNKQGESYREALVRNLKEHKASEEFSEIVLRKFDTAIEVGQDECMTTLECIYSMMDKGIYHDYKQ